MDDKVREQAVNVAKLPGIQKASFAMPDAHWGAYKDVSAVVEAADYAGLSRMVARLDPVICIKG